MSTKYILKYIILWLAISCLFIGIRVFSITVIRKEVFKPTYEDVLVLPAIVGVLMILQFLRIRQVSRKGVR
jgi:hypothetical protein